MIFFAQIIAFFLVFSGIFYCIRLIPGMDLHTLKTSSEGAGWLYSAIGLIFGVLAAFTIQTQAKKWDELLQSIRKEVNNLRRLLWLSYTLPKPQAKRISKSIFGYLNLIVHEGWKDIDSGHRSLKLETCIHLLQDEVFDIFKDNPSYLPTATSLINGVFESREERMFHSAKRTPLLLKGTIYMGGLMMIVLSYFIGVGSIWIDYIFTGCIAFLTILIIMVMEDLEHPYHPGHWHITQDDYHSLLEEIPGSI